MLPEVPFPVKNFAAVSLLVLAFASVSTNYAPAQTPAIKVETGVLDNAPFRIDMPEKWNGVLLIYYHGYSENPVTYDKSDMKGLSAGLASAGFAVAQSGYSETGFAIEHAVPETEALRRYTIAHYGQPKETYVLGHSMGGQLTMITIENYPNRYDGALPLCGLLQPTTWAIGRGAAMLAAFHYYYPGLLPGPVGISADTVLDEKLVDKVLAALPSNEKGLKEMMALGHFKTERDLADGVVFGSFIQRDFEQKLGASVMETRNYLYAGGTDDDALNEGVKRYAGSETALAYLKSWYTPTGILLKPTLAVHTTYDPIIPADTVRLYSDQVQRAGSSANFVQQFVKADGHCHIGGPETVTALQELIAWKRTGARPVPGIVPVAK